MLVREAMTTPAATVTMQASTEAAARLMRDEQIGAIPVVDRRGVLVGVVRRPDLEKAGRQCVGDTMRHHVVTIGPDDEIHEALDRMCAAMVDGLPVVDGTRVVGTVRRADLTELLSPPCQTCEVEYSAGTARDADAVPAAT
ncbi:HPP family protein [Kribbella sp. NPDC004875]|uniref:CBS domain-containing protein n=1 Tax=Kribbella sp. NPDC004875 TaxID=3364107 RepID=UPI00367D7153